MMKYLVFTLPNSGIERIHVFDQNEKHADVAKTLQGDIYSTWKPVRGGFVGFIPEQQGSIQEQLKCWGEAFSLGLRSNPERDTALLLKWLEV